MTSPDTPEHTSSRKLLTPGPVELAPSVRSALAGPITFHKGRHFHALFRRVVRGLSDVFDAGPEHEILLLPGSGTLANECMIASLLSEQDRVLAVSNGLFGDRLIDILTVHAVPHYALRFPPFAAVDTARVADAMTTSQCSAVMLVGLETSTGLANPLHEIATLCRDRAIPLLVDAVSALVAEPLSVAEDGIAAITGVPNKALEGPPGLAFICARRDFLNLRLGRRTPRSYYLDLARYRAAATALEMPVTPDVTALAGLDAALEDLARESIEGRRARYRRHVDRLWSLASNLPHSGGATYSAYRSGAIVTLALPPDVVNAAAGALERSGYVVHVPAPRPEPWPIALMQIAVMGDITDADVEAVCASLADTLLTGHLA